MLFLASFFCVLVIISNILTPKLIEINEIAFPAGLLTYPFTFLISNFVTEIYGKNHAKQMVYLGFCMSIFAAILFKFALFLPSQNQSAFIEVFGQNALIVFASMTAFIITQLLDISIYSWLRQRQYYLGVCSNVSTLFSQAIDTLIVTLLTFVWAFDCSWIFALNLSIYSYLYKILFNLAFTPLYYFAVYVAKKRLNLLNLPT